MLKKSALRRIILASLALVILLIIYFFPTNSNQIESSLTYVDPIEMPIFLIDNNDYVARTTIVKNKEDVKNKKLTKRLILELNSCVLNHL